MVKSDDKVVLSREEFDVLVRDLRTIVILNAVVVTENAMTDPTSKLEGSPSREAGRTAEIAWEWLHRWGVGYR